MLCRALARASEWRVGDFKPQELAKIAWACGTADQSGANRQTDIGGPEAVTDADTVHHSALHFLPPLVPRLEHLIARQNAGHGTYQTRAQTDRQTL